MIFWKILRFLYPTRNRPQYIPPDYPKNITPLTPIQSGGIFNKLMSSDKHDVWSGSYDVIRTREQGVLNELGSNLDDIIESTNRKIRNGTNSKVHPLDHAIEHLALYLRGDKCMCSLYTYKGFSHYDPEQEACEKHVKITSKVLHESGWGHVWNCKCNDCGVEYVVENREYHGPWWQWNRVVPI